MTLSIRGCLAYVGRGACGAFLIALPGSAAAQQPARPPAPRVEDLVAEAMANAPSIAARRARLAAAQAALPAADVLPDPMVEFE